MESWKWPRDSDVGRSKCVRRLDKMELVAGKSREESGLRSWDEWTREDVGRRTSVAWVEHRRCSAARKCDEEMHKMCTGEGHQ